MDFLQTITLISPNSEEITFKNAYIHDNNQIAVSMGNFMPSKKHIAIIPASECRIEVGYVAKYDEKTRLVVGVSDNTKKSKIMPHIRLTLE